MPNYYVPGLAPHPALDRDLGCAPLTHPCPGASVPAPSPAVPVADAVQALAAVSAHALPGLAAAEGAGPALVFERFRHPDVVGVPALQPSAAVSVHALPGLAAGERVGPEPVFERCRHPDAVGVPALQPSVAVFDRALPGLSAGEQAGPELDAEYPAVLGFSPEMLPALPVEQLPVFFVLPAA